MNKYYAFNNIDCYIGFEIVKIIGCDLILKNINYVY